jgi:WD40 repeat protein
MDVVDGISVAQYSRSAAMPSKKFASLAGILLATLSVILGGRPVTAGESKPAAAKPKAALPAQFKQQQPVVKPTDYFTSVAISRDGKTIASASFYGKVKLWEATTGKNTLVLDIAEVTSLAISRDGKTLACACMGSFGVNGLRPEGVKLFDVAGGEKFAILEKDGVNAIAFSPDGERLACAKDTVKGHAVPPVLGLWRAVAAKKTATITVDDNNSHMVSAVAFHPDGKKLVSGGGTHDAAGKILPRLQLWDIATGKNTVNFVGHTGHVLCATFHRDGKILASSGNDATVRLWDVATGKNIATLEGHKQPTYSVVFSPDGKTLASGSDDKTIRLWDVATGKNTLTIKTVGVRALAFSPDGKTLVAAGEGALIRVWDAATGEMTKVLE